jgi:hypothetical protein
MSERTTDEPYVTHMLGYLTPGKWADAIRNGFVDKDWAVAMMRIQERRYELSLVPDVVYELGEEWNGLGGVEIDFETGTIKRMKEE